MAALKHSDELEAVDIHDVLSNERRQMVLTLLQEDNDAEMTARELSERIAELETNESPAPRNIRQSAYVSLHQTHLPKLDELGIIEYDQSAKSVRLEKRADQVSVYMETVPKYGISWSEYYLGMSLLGILFVLAATINVPFISSIGGGTWALLLFVIIAGSAIYQTYQQGSSLIHRLQT